MYEIGTIYLNIRNYNAYSLRVCHALSREHYGRKVLRVQHLRCGNFGAHGMLKI
jgi:hypothetical protein